MAEKTEIPIKKEAASPVATLSRQSPFVTLRREIDRLFDDIVMPDFLSPLTRRIAAVEPVRHWTDALMLSPATDLLEDDGAYKVQAELPGLDLADVEVKLSDGLLTIKGEKSYAHEEKDTNFHLRERSFGKFQRSFRLPDGIDTDKIAARFENGVLTVQMPKTAEAKEKERKIAVTAA